MTENNVIVSQLASVFAEAFHIEAPSPDTDLIESGILDSFQFVELLLQLEQRFGLRIALEEITLDDLRTLGRIAELVARHGRAAVNGARTQRPAACS